MIIATSGVRDAQGGEDFIAGLAGKFSFEHKILTGEEEAAMSFIGSTLDADPSKRIMLLDIGGGSTEIAAGCGGKADYLKSMKLGCVRLKERFFHHDPVSLDEIGQAVRHIKSLLKSQVHTNETGAIESTIAVAGTVTSLAAIDLGLQKYERNVVHGHLLSKEQVEILFDRLAGMSNNERMRVPVLESGRSDVIVAGSLILVKVMEYLGIEMIKVSEHDILDGAALWLAGLTN